MQFIISTPFLSRRLAVWQLQRITVCLAKVDISGRTGWEGTLGLKTAKLIGKGEKKTQKISYQKTQENE